MFKKNFVISLGITLIFVMSNVSFAMTCGSHSKQQHTAQAESNEHRNTQVDADDVTPIIAKEAVSVGNKICPVSGEEIDPKMKATYEYEGKIYNFCCTSCIEEFKKDPQKYIEKINEQKQGESKMEEMQPMEMTQESKSPEHNQGMH